MDEQDLAAHRDEYLQRVIAALGAYLQTGSDLRLESSREIDELAITFTLTNAAHYQELLAHLTGDEVAGPQADNLNS